MAPVTLEKLRKGLEYFQKQNAERQKSIQYGRRLSGVVLCKAAEGFESSRMLDASRSSRQYA